jgi:hypothetical protein
VPPRFVAEEDPVDVSCWLSVINVLVGVITHVRLPHLRHEKSDGGVQVEVVASGPWFAAWLPTQTNGSRPVKITVPPRTCIVRSPLRSQLKPTRGDHRIFESGNSFHVNCSGFRSSSRNVRASAVGVGGRSVR